jgi:hypothetical protein
MSAGIRKDIITFNGRYFDFTNISQNKIEIVDIAKGLSNVCRFAGQCDRFYSVAEHSVLVSRIVERAGCSWRVVFAALMHDVSEALLGDMTSPLKSLLPEYKVIESEVQTYLIDRLAPLAITDHPFIRVADLIALAVEQRDVMHNTDVWGALTGTYGNELIAQFNIHESLMPEGAYELFLNRYTECLVNSGRNAPQAFLPLGEPR